ncbi:hypothetical protein P7C73_g1956, partial [Tremellales sp. Uapishka_1]
MAARPRPGLLQPPETIVSPPSPVEATQSHPPTFSTPPRPSSPETYDSPEDESDSESRSRPRAPSDQLRPMPLAADQMSTSPGLETCYLHPESPSPSLHTPSPRAPRSPSPSSPHFRPKSLHHRRTSSTHRVRETIDGERKPTEDGGTMVNQYKIGKSLGQGAYAKVELGVDVGTGQEYAVKEFSKSRLHHQALQRKQQSMRGRVRRGRPLSRGSPNGPGTDGKRKAGEQDAHKMGEPNGGPWSTAGANDEEENDPLGLIRREIAVMKKLDHPNVSFKVFDDRYGREANDLQIVHLYEAISVPSEDSLFLVLEYLPGGTLMEVKIGEEEDHKEHHSPFTLEQTREYFRQLCLGLEYLHANEVVHRDIKPDNILLSDDRATVKLCDFGVSEMFVASGDDRIKKSGGSPAFLSPESFTSSMGDLHGRAVDIWALGVTLYCMLTGKLPFNVTNPIDLFSVVRDKEPEIPAEWSDDLKELVSKMLEKDPEHRICMAAIREHPWTTDHGEEPMITTDDNLYHVGKKVEEPTQEELGNAIASHRSVFTVIRAVQKMRRLHLNRRSPSGQTPSSPGSTTQSGSMDSYNSKPDSDSTAPTDEKWGTEDHKVSNSPETEKEGEGYFEQDHHKAAEKKEDVESAEEGVVVDSLVAESPEAVSTPLREDSTTP